MRHARNALFGAVAVGDVLQHREQILRLAVVVAHRDVAGGRHPDAVSGRVDFVVGDQDRVFRSQRRVVFRDHVVRVFLRIDLAQRLADDVVAPHAEQLFARAVDQRERAFAGVAVARRHVLDEERNRHVFDNGVEEFLRLAKPLLRAPPLADILEHGEQVARAVVVVAHGDALAGRQLRRAVEVTRARSGRMSGAWTAASRCSRPRWRRLVPSGRLRGRSCRSSLRATPRTAFRRRG